MWNPIGRAMYKEAVQMFAAPIEGTLKNFMEFAETGFADHEQAPPHQRTHSAEHYAKFIDRKGRYGRFRHVGSLPKTHLLPRNRPPRISRSPHCRASSDRCRISGLKRMVSTF